MRSAYENVENRSRVRIQDAVSDLFVKKSEIGLKRSENCSIEWEELLGSTCE